MVIKAVIFDLDQALLDRTTSLQKFLNWQIDALGLIDTNLKSDFIQRFIEIDANGTVWKDQVYQQLIDEFGITQYTVSELLQIYIQDFNQFSTPFADVVFTIKQLFEQGFRLGLISNGKSPFQEHNFQALAVQNYFSSVIVSEAVQLRKPEPAIFQLACAQLNVELFEAVYVGDNEKVDVDGAKNAGLNAIHFQPNILDLDTRTTHLTISSFKILLTYLLEHADKI